MYSTTALATILCAGFATAVWTPAAGTSWQISLSTAIDPTKALTPDVDAYDVDLFDVATAETVTAFHAKGKKVICYFSAGSYESTRPDSSKFTAADLGSVMDGWPDETWLNIMSSNVRSIMSARIALAATNGCDAVDPDNVDAYGNSNGLGLTEANAVDYIKFLTTTAAANNIAIGLKNAGSIISQVHDVVHFSVNEQCHEYSECDLYQPFIQTNKPVFNIEYPDSAKSKSLVAEAPDYCASATTDSQGFSTLIKDMDLDTWAQVCAIANPPSSSAAAATSGAAATSAPAAYTTTTATLPAYTASASSTADAVTASVKMTTLSTVAVRTTVSQQSYAVAPTGAGATGTGATAKATKTNASKPSSAKSTSTKRATAAGVLPTGINPYYPTGTGSHPYVAATAAASASASRKSHHLRKHRQHAHHFNDTEDNVYDGHAA